MQLVIPALSIRRNDGTFDELATIRLAACAASTWADMFILNGTTTGGHNATSDERERTVEIWATQVASTRLVACCWNLDDADKAARYGVTPMFVIQGQGTEAALQEYFAELPTPHYLFSHPEFSPVTLTPQAVAEAAARGTLGAGVKVSKVPPSTITEIRSAAGPSFAIWDGTSRHIQASLDAGADGAVAAPLSHIPQPFPRRDLVMLQAEIDATQQYLDSFGGRAARTAAVLAMAGSEPRPPTRGDRP